MKDREQKPREELEGCRQIMELDQAVLAAVLEQTGPVTVGREAIRRNLQEKRQVRAAYDTAAGVYSLWLEGEDGVV